MPNPYHDETGRFCSKEEMQGAIKRLGEKGDLEGYFHLRNEYEELNKKNSASTSGGLFSRLGKNRDNEPKPVAAPIQVAPIGLKEPFRADVAQAGGFGYEPYGENFKVTKVGDVRKVLGTIFHCPADEIPNDLYDYAVNDLHMDKPESYEVEVSEDYYNEPERTIRFTKSKELTEWFLKQENARDNAGVLDYVRSKGIPTSGKTPLQAIKEQLSFENNGRLSKAVQVANRVAVYRIELDKIKFDKKKMQSTSPAPVQSDNKTSKKIAGVLVKDGKNYVLVDGYQRTKGLGNQETASYILLY